MDLLVRSPCRMARLHCSARTDVEAIVTGAGLAALGAQVAEVKRGAAHSRHSQRRPRWNLSRQGSFIGQPEALPLHSLEHRGAKRVGGRGTVKPSATCIPTTPSVDHLQNCYRRDLHELLRSRQVGNSEQSARGSVFAEVLLVKPIDLGEMRAKIPHVNRGGDDRCHDSGVGNCQPGNGPKEWCLKKAAGPHIHFGTELPPS